MQSSLLLPHYLGLSYGHFVPSVSFFVSTLVSFINSASSGLIQQSLGQDLTQRGVFEEARWRKEGGREGWKEVRVNIYGLTISVWVGGRESERAWQREECAQRARSGRAQGGFVWETRESQLDWNRVLGAADEQRTTGARSGRAVGSRRAFKGTPWTFSGWGRCDHGRN